MKPWQLLTLLGLVLVARGAPAAPASGSALPAQYRFGPGDVIDVTVLPQHSFDRTVTVQPDGKISFAIVGQIQAAGLTVDQLVQKLHDGLNQELVDPSVTISLRETSKQELGRVSLLGAVRSPGGLEIKEGTTLAAALASSGGPGPTADLHRVTITHAGGSEQTVDMAQTDRTGRVGPNPVLQAGDIIVVPEGAPPTVLVLGDVARPGSYPLPQEARLLDAISQAGGAAEKADLRRVTVARPGVSGSRVLDLQPLLAKGDTTHPELNVLLHPGDTIFVPESQQQIYILGDVSKPGLYPIQPNDRVLDLLVAAGGAGAGVSRAILVRRGANGQSQPRPLDLKKLLAKGDQSENARLQSGDVLYVPDKKNHSNASDALGLLWPLTSLLSFLRL